MENMFEESFNFTVPYQYLPVHTGMIYRSTERARLEQRELSILWHMLDKITKQLHHIERMERIQAKRERFLLSKRKKRVKVTESRLVYK